MVRTYSMFWMLVAVVSVTVLVPVFVDAQAAQSQGTFVPLSDANFQNLFGTQGTSGTQTDLNTFIKGMFRVVLSLGAILAVMRIAWAGFRYMTSDAAGQKSSAKEILGDVTIGLLLLLSIWLILNQINPDILTIELKSIK